MLPLPDVEVTVPRSLDDALAALAHAHRDGRRARVLAGGTDLVPNLKRGLDAPDLLVALGAVRGLDEVREVDGALRIGALAKLARVAAHPLVGARAKVVAEAAAQIASPQIREMGTVGGNLCLDTRCRHVNQTAFWREALGHCIKAPGEREAPPCHVVPGGRRCVASASADLPPVLIALGARVRVASADAGAREIDVASLYRADGAAPIALAPGELVVELIVPTTRRRAAYQKLRARDAVDFPLLGVAVAIDVDEAEICRDVRVVASCVTPAPREVSGLDPLAVGKRIDADVVAAIAARCRAGLHPLATIGADVEWRRDMIPVLVRRAFAALGLGARDGRDA